MKVKLKIKPLIFVMLTILAFSCQKQKDTTSQIQSLQSSVNNLQKRSDSISSELQVTNYNLSGLENSVNSLNNQIDSTVVYIAKLKRKIGEPNSNTSEIASQITLLNNQLNDLEIQLNSITVELGTQSSTIKTGLVGYYPFDGTADDLSGNRNNGELYGPAVTVGHELKSNRAFQFNNNYIEVKNSPLLNPTAQLSISVWVNLTRYLDNQNFVSKSFTSQSEPYSSYSLKMGDPGINKNVQFQVALNGRRTTVTSKRIIPLKTWVFITGVYNGSTIQIYINGTLDNSVAASGAITYYNTNLNFGRWSAGVPNQPQFLDGTLDDIRIYNRALTQTEINGIKSLGNRLSINHLTNDKITITFSRSELVWISLILVMGGIGAYFFNKKQKSKSRLFNGSNIHFDQVELALIKNILIKGQNGSLTTQEVNTILNLDSKTLENQRKLRVQIIKEINHKIKLEFNIDEAIERSDSDEDKRLNIYRLKRQAITVFSNLLKNQ